MMALPSDDWRQVPFSPYRNYEASCDGRVRRGGRELKGDVDRYGYRRVNLSYAGISKSFKVHRIVCETFNGPCPEGFECAHLDGNKLNNSSANLAWVTRSENQRHNIRHGIHGGGVSGSRHQSAKLTETIVAQARERHAAGESGRKLAREFGVTSAVMSEALRGASWKHVATKPCAQSPAGDPS